MNNEPIKINVPEELKAKFKDPDGAPGWESPVSTYIQRVSTEIAEKTDAYILEQIHNIGVHVDKEELIKAISYDRNQYEKGYKRGYGDGYSKGIDDCFERLREIITGGINEDQRDNSI